MSSRGAATRGVSWAARRGAGSEAGRDTAGAGALAVDDGQQLPDKIAKRLGVTPDRVGFYYPRNPHEDISYFVKEEE